VSSLIGCGVVLACVPFKSSAHQSLSALVLAPLVWSCARQSRWMLGMWSMVCAFICHSLTVIALTQIDPALGSSLTPDGDQYWAKQLVWITTGSDPEYEWAAWGPAHLQLFLGTTVYSLSSFGLITLQQGFYEVDLMNYYNGRLILASDNGWLAICFGWHLWSLLRGCGYVVLTYELTSLGLQIAIGQSLATWQSRLTRWSIGIGFLVLDATVKWSLLELVRQALFANLA
jgi:hypothetical protein